MSFLFSPSTGGFYRKGLSKRIPADAVAVSAERHAALMAAQANGATIIASTGKGQPIAKLPADTVDAVRARFMGEIKREAGRRINAVSSAWRQLNDLRVPSEAGAARFAAIDTIRASSNAIEALLAETANDALDTFPVADNPLWPIIEDLA